MDRLLDQVDDSAHIGADESIDESEFGDYYKPPVDDGSFGKDVDSFAQEFVHEFSDETMDTISDYAGLSFDCLRHGESISDYFQSDLLSPDQIAEIKDAIGSYADREFSDMDNLPENDKQYIVSHVWPKVQKYLTGLGFQLEESINEWNDASAEYHVGASACANGIARDANPHEQDSEEYQYWDSGWEKEASQERAAHHMDMEDQYGAFDEDVATMVHPAMVDGKHVATDFGPGTIVDSIPGGVKVELQNGEVIDVPEGEFDVLESRIREEAELDAWFEAFDPTSVLAPVELDEYQLEPGDTRLSTGDRVVHKKFGPGNVVSVEGNFAKVKFDRANALLPQDRTVTLSPGILYKVSQDASAIRKEPEPQAQPGDKIRRKAPYEPPVQMKPGDKIRRKDWKPATAESFELSEEVTRIPGQPRQQRDPREGLPGVEPVCKSDHH
jgi:hypothetical protein